MRRIDYSLLVIDKLIIHDIPKHRKNEIGSPYYSENESTITDGLRTFFQDKIKAALISDQAFKVCFKNTPIPSVPACVISILNSDVDFIEKSKEIARNLYDIQQGNNAAGILLILKGNISDFPVCVILKLERDNGAQLILDSNSKTFNVEEVKDLMLTRKTKVFKVALFTVRSNFEIDYDGHLMDYQINIKNKNGTDTFFLNFMGCVPYMDPKIATKNFYDLTKEYINTIPDSLLRSKYTQDLNSYLQKNQSIINPIEFANDYMIDTEHKNGYREFLQTKKFELTAYAKDDALIKTYINKILIEFENGVSLLGGNGTFEDKVLFTNDEKTGECKAEIKSKIRKVK